VRVLDLLTLPSDKPERCRPTIVLPDTDSRRLPKVVPQNKKRLVHMSIFLTPRTSNQCTPTKVNKQKEKYPKTLKMQNK
jgi:hypothetical protein